MTAIVTTNSVGTGVRVSFAPGDIVDIVPGVTVGSTDGSIAMYCTTAGTTPISIFVGGQVFGYDAVFANSTSANVNLTVSATGLLVGNGGDGYAGLGSDKIENYGLIRGDANGAEINDATFDNVGSVSGGGHGIQIDLSGYITNEGTISSLSSVSGDGIFGSTGAAEVTNTGTINGRFAGIDIENANLQVVNSGTIASTVGAYSIHAASLSAHEQVDNTKTGVLNGDVRLDNASALVNNAGAIYGSVYAGMIVNTGLITGGITELGTATPLTNYGVIQGNVSTAFGTSANAGTILGNVSFAVAGIFNSTFGSVAGGIYTGVYGGTVVAGQTGGSVVGGTAADIFYANPTRVAADNAAKTSLDAGAGTNALYGDGAFTTFFAGDSNGGYNQIWGGSSQMAGVAGFINNTLSFANAANGVYVDLMNGHDAYVSTSTSWAGSGTFEDAIVDVPNVVGSAQGDLLQADAGTDRLTGGGSGDILYAGGGQDTFVYTAYGDSNLVSGYDTVANFKIGTDKVDLSTLHVGGDNVAISTAGTSNTIYVEMHPSSGFNSATDLALIVATTASGGLHASDFVF